jgi:hypothetical protein
LAGHDLGIGDRHVDSAGEGRVKSENTPICASVASRDLDLARTVWVPTTIRLSASATFTPPANGLNGRKLPICASVCWLKTLTPDAPVARGDGHATEAKERTVQPAGEGVDVLTAGPPPGPAPTTISPAEIRPAAKRTQIVATVSARMSHRRFGCGGAQPPAKAIP